MYPDSKYREYMLGLAGAEIEADVEEAILDGRVDPEHLHQIEEELIDDLLFDRLSAEEKRVIRSTFLSTPTRARSLEFGLALQQYAAQHLPEPSRRTIYVKLREWAAVSPSVLPLAGALACCMTVTFWLAERNLALSRQLVQTAQANDEHQRAIASMQEEQHRRATQPDTSIHPSPATIAAGDQSESRPTIELSPGANRGLAVVPVLHLKKQAITASIVLELPFKPMVTLREELLSSDNKQIWSQQFSNVVGISAHGLTTVVLPAELFATGEYRLRAEADSSGDVHGSTATYLFRVRKD